MLIEFKRNRRICLLLCMIVLLLTAWVVVVGAVDPVGDIPGIPGIPGLYLEADGNPHPETGEKMVYLCMTASLDSLSGGGMVALGMTLEIGEGWIFDRVSVCEGAEGMTATAEVGAEGTRLTCLLDGEPPSEAGESGNRLLKLTVVPSAAMPSEGVTAEISILDHTDLYYMDPQGRICRVTLTCCHTSAYDTTTDEDEGDSKSPVEPAESETNPVDFSTETTDDIDFVTSEIPSDVEKHPETEPPIPQETTGKPDDMIFETTDEPPETIPPPSPQDHPAHRSVYLGCQETPVENGEYGVRFLFVGATPVICAEGGGYLSAEITAVSEIEAFEGCETRIYPGNWSVCTFRGLRAEGTYAFIVYTDGRAVSIRYAAGKYIGTE